MPSAAAYDYLDWTRFKQRLIQHLNARITHFKFEADLRRTVQQQNESVEIFISQKLRLLQRLNMPETPQMIRKFVHYLPPEISIHLVRGTPQTMDQLVEEVFQMGLHLEPAQNPP